MSEARQEVAAPRTPLRAHDPGSPPSRQRLWCGTTGPVAHCPRTHPAQTRARVLDLTSTIQTHGTQNRLRACVRTGPPCCCCCCLLLLRCGMLARARQAPAPSARPAAASAAAAAQPSTPSCAWAPHKPHVRVCVLPAALAWAPPKARPRRWVAAAAAAAPAAAAATPGAHPRAHGRAHTRLGYIMTRTEAPRLLGGRFLRNLARTAPVVPCARVTLPHMQRK